MKTNMIVCENKFASYKSRDIVSINLQNSKGNSISLVNLGARINKFLVKRKDGKFDNIILGYDNLEDMLKARSYFYGASIGRVGGRISKASFNLGNKNYKLDNNDGKNHLHGGKNGYDLKIWDYKIKSEKGYAKVIFSLKDKSLDKNYYPGNIDIKIIHSFNENDEWTIEYEYKTDQTTIANPTNHVYFNLNGNNSRNILNHELKIKSNFYVSVDKEGIPICIKRVENTPYDFNNFKKIEDIVNVNHDEIINNKGLDNPFILNKISNQIVLKNSSNKRKIILNTERPAVVIYTHGKVGEKIKVSGNDINPYSGIALETQYLPDSINRKDFNDIIIKPGKIYKSKTKYSFKEY